MPTSDKSRTGQNLINRKLTGRNLTDRKLTHQNLLLKPISFFQCSKEQSLETASQGNLDPSSKGIIDLSGLPQWREMMEGLEGFSHLWILFIFDRTQSQWRPKVWPPRSKKKVGLWASRSPHRPNPIGMTAVKILSIEGPTITVQGHDLMNQTPIVDIKPYLTYADSIPDARLGWLETEQEYSLEFSERAKAEVAFLEKQGLTEFSSALHQQLRFHPTDRRRKRVRPLKSPAATAGSFCFSYRTWRVDFHLDDTIVYIHGLRSGYEPEEILLPEDPHNDKDLHRRFTHWQRGAFF